MIQVYALMTVVGEGREYYVMLIAVTLLWSL